MAESSGASGALDVQAVLADGQGHWVVDPDSSAVEFHVKHFWGLITIHGRFERISGEGTIDSDGRISGRLEIDATSLTTKNRKRDVHLRSADFFDVEHHPAVVVSLDNVVPAGPHTLRGQITVETAGERQMLESTVDVLDATATAVTLRCELVVDRTVFGMTWSPLGMASPQARAVVTARFVRQ